MADETIDYDVVSEFAGHTKNRGVSVVEAARDIFSKVKEKAMQAAVNGVFISFNTVDDLQEKLSNAAKSGFTIRVFDELIGG